MVNNLLFRTDKISTQKFPSQRGAFGCVSVRFRVRVVWAKAYLFVLLYPHTIWNMNLLILFCFWKEEGKNLHISFSKKQAHYILLELFYNKDLIAFWFKSPKNRNTIKSIMIVKIVNYKIWSSYYDKQLFYDRLVWNCLRYHVECIENAQHMWPPIDKEKLKRRSCYDGNNDPMFQGEWLTHP